jgi:hypothetical protein
MEVLGRNANVIPVASGQPFKMRDASSALIVMTGTSATSILIQEQSGFAGSPVSLFAIKNIYYSTATNGTAAWGKLTYVPGVTVAGIYLTGLPAATFLLSALNTAVGGTNTMIAFTIFSSELSDPYNYIVPTMGGSGGITCSVILSDLTVQRGPANLPILSA